jgi:hypothetical protein
MASVSFTGKISPNFDLKNMVSPYTKNNNNNKYFKYFKNHGKKNSKFAKF